MVIVSDDLTNSQVIALLQEHLDDMALHSPPESVHALDLDALRSSDVTFYSAWQDSSLMGCGAIMELGSSWGEVKSMRTAKAHLRKGVAASLLSHLLEVARSRNYQRLSLETGSMKAFAPAHQLYSSFGFLECEPFADYELDPFSIFMTLEL